MALNKSIRDEKGQALILVLILLLLAGLIIAPLLAFMSTGLKSGQLFENKMYQFYAADTGVEDALWKIKNEELPPWMQGTWDENAYSHDPYMYPDSSEWKVNDKDVKVSIQPVWVLEDLEQPVDGRTSPDELIVAGAVIGQTADKTKGIYQIKIIYDGTLGELQIDKIGFWLPAGFEYVTMAEDESDLDAAPTEDSFDFRGGTAIWWDTAENPSFTFPAEITSSRVIVFQFAPSGNPQAAFSWVRASQLGNGNLYLSWDCDLKVYKITSAAEEPDDPDKKTTVEAYTVKSEFRKIGTGIGGDYYATGNSLMTATEDELFRDRLFEKSSATITNANIPLSDDTKVDTKVEKVFLYWSGWREFPDDITGFTAGELVAEAGVDQIVFEVDGTPVGVIPEDGDTPLVTVDVAQVEQNERPKFWGMVPNGWSYSCFADVTDLINKLIADEELPKNGAGTYTLGHVASEEETDYPLYDIEDGPDPIAWTGYPLGTPAESYSTKYQWAYAGWSLVIIYSSPETKGHQLYLFDDFHYVPYATTGTDIQFPISGFLAPDDPTGSHLTCFVGEGDGCKTGDYIAINGIALSDDYNPVNNVFNAYSNAVDEEFRSMNGIDIDTFDMSIEPAATSAEVILGTDKWPIEEEYEIYNLVYIILSFRSEITTGGTITYLIR